MGTYDPLVADPIDLIENMLVMNQILNSMEEGIAGSFKYSDTAEELWESIEAV